MAISILKIQKITSRENCANKPFPIQNLRVRQSDDSIGANPNIYKRHRT